MDNFNYLNLPRVPKDFLEQCDCPETNCGCTKDSGIHEWEWDKSFETPRLQLDEKNLEVKFHPGFSIGTAAIRGNKSMSKGRHHYWEVKMITPVYGTDVMVGIGTKKADLTSTVECFCSLLGRDCESWGYSYKGYIQHNGQTKLYNTSFKQGSSVGVYLDTWKGTLQFFLDRKPLGIAFTGLRNLELYPMVCSTAAKSKMKVIYSSSMPASLQLECLSMLKPVQRAYLSAAFPGLEYLSKSVFAELLQKPKDNSDDSDEEFEFSKDCFELDDFDYALICCNKFRKKPRKKRRLDSDFLSRIPPATPSIPSPSSLKALMHLP